MDSKKNERVLCTEIYTDGSLKKLGKITFGAWAFIATRDQQSFHIDAQSCHNTTNQRMELTAVLKALKYIEQYRRPSEKIIIYTDSAYIINCYLQEWYIKWQRIGWINANGSPVANVDLWKEIIPYFDNYWYDFRKVPGHAGNYWNEKCDEIAQSYAQTLKENWRG